LCARLSCCMLSARVCMCVRDVCARWRCCMLRACVLHVRVRAQAARALELLHAARAPVLHVHMRTWAFFWLLHAARACFACAQTCVQLQNVTLLLMHATRACFVCARACAGSVRV
jgi:hypothetical protein